MTPLAVVGSKCRRDIGSNETELAVVHLESTVHDSDRSQSVGRANMVNWSSWNHWAIYMGGRAF